MENKKKVNKKNILELISSEDIFQFYIGPCKPGKCIVSPFRSESIPSFYINNKSGDYYYSDLADSNYKGDCFRLIMQLYNISFIEALNRIASDFGLPLEGTEVKNYEKIIKELPKHKITPPTIVEVVPRTLSDKEKIYWEKHLQTIPDLEREYTGAFASATINGKEVYKEEGEMAFYYEHEGKYKLYFPERKNGQFKWMGNFVNTFVENKNALIGAKKGIIAGSKKDRVVLQALGVTNVANTQNEGNSAFTPDFVNFLRENCEEIYLFYDNDLAGKRAVETLSKEFGFKSLFVPEETGKKDWAQWVYDDGPLPAIKYLVENRII